MNGDNVRLHGYKEFKRNGKGVEIAPQIYIYSVLSISLLLLLVYAVQLDWSILQRSYKWFWSKNKAFRRNLKFAFFLSFLHIDVLKKKSRKCAKYVSHARAAWLLRSYLDQ